VAERASRRRARNTAGIPGIGFAETASLEVAARSTAVPVAGSGTWIEALSEPGEVASGEAASHMDTLASVESFRVGEPCDRVTFAASRGMSRLALARDGAALHPAGRDATHELVRLGHEGHCGARRALAEHFAAFVAARTARGEDQRKAEAEWWRLARGAVGKLSGPPNEACDCDLLRGEALLFEWSPAPAETETAKRQRARSARCWPSS
jgi:hypothetical protein